MRRIFVCLQPCCVGRIASYATETTRLKTDKKTSKVGGLFVSSCLSTINGCATYTDGWVYDEKTDKYLSGQEIKSLVSGNTIVYFDSNGTKEYYDKSGIMYIFYQTDDEYHNSHWCIKENKLCIDSSGLKLICPKITINNDESISYDRDVIKIEKGDSYELKKTCDENDWEIQAKKNCTF